MKREIKFRRPHYSRDGKFYKFTYWGFIDGAFVSPATISGYTQKDDEQYTGILDRKGVAIYEGNIVQYKNYLFECEVGEVTFSANQGFRISIKSKPTELLIPIRRSKCTIIGNIHENPDLL